MPQGAACCVIHVAHSTFRRGKDDHPMAGLRLLHSIQVKGSDPLVENLNLNLK